MARSKRILAVCALAAGLLAGTAAPALANRHQTVHPAASTSLHALRADVVTPPPAAGR